MSDERWQARFGACPVPGGVRFCVWAPRQPGLRVRVDDTSFAMAPEGKGEFAVAVPGVAAGADYFYEFPDGRLRPDPASRWQPAGVHGPSRVVDAAAFRWTDAGWHGLALEEHVFYELHTGTFTSEATFAGVIPKLGYLRDLGVTAVELMPVAEFPGARNWGYDGVALYAPHAEYGGPAGLRQLVDACHARGLAVVLDVVYNHLGPEGNYLGEFGPYFTDAYRTAWGPAINYDGAESDAVRRFAIDNALYWLTEYHIDALRLDAIHGIFDFSARHILEELGEAFHAQAARLGRQAWVIAESDLNDTRVIRPRDQGGYGLDAQWHDDFHHALFTALTGPAEGYLEDFGRMEDLRKAIAEGFVYDGRYSAHRRRRHGNSSRERPGRQFVVCVQNHDQVANATRGERLSRLATVEQQKLAATLLVCAPFLPLLFMGQEYGEPAPFHYFTSHGDPDLIEAVREGRKREFAAFQGAGGFADPQALETFLESRLDWRLPEKPPHDGLLRYYRDLLALRRRHACLRNCRKDLTRVTCDERARWLVMERGDPGGSAAVIACNFAPEPQAVPVRWEGAGWQPAPAGDTVTLEGFGTAVYVRPS